MAEPGPFGRTALELFDLGLCPIPCGGDDGKQPLVTTSRWRRRPGRNTVAQWVGQDRFGNANVGVLTGPSGVTILDIDRPEDTGALIELFGATPLITMTPSGGEHHWYLATGERCANLRPLGFGADVKAAGGFVVVPPSVRPGGQHAGRRYTLSRGTWAAVRDLRPIGAAARALLGEKTAPSACQDPPQGPEACAASAVRIGEGGRNDALFKECLRIARGCETEDELIAEAHATNRIALEPPLPDREVERTARSAWRYEASGQNFAIGGGFACSRALMETIGDADAFWLFARLQMAHPDKIATATPFAISPRAMAKAGAVRPLGERRIRQARDHLVKAGVLLELHHGGRRKGDPSLYAFARLDRTGIDRAA